ncbi:MAG TPA: hypothetical protein VH592_21325 [Gemmataceae bacterium]|jgi:hypothetical protein
MRRAKLPALALMGFVLLAGCSGGGPRFNPVQGKVLWRGKPPVGARVIFHPIPQTPNQLQPSALVEEDGSFHLKTYVPGNRRDYADGATSGEYRVTIDWFPLSGKSLSVGKAPLTDKLEGRYADPERSSLQATVKDGENVLPPFELK